MVHAACWALAATLLSATGGTDPLPMPPPPVLKPAPLKLARIVLPDLKVTGEVPELALASLGQVLHAELRKMEAVSLLTASEIREILSMERQKQLLGCGDETNACVAELAGALDASELLAGELSLVGKTYTFTLRRTNILKAQVQSKTRTFAQKDGEELLAVVGPMIQELYPDRPLLPGKTRGVSPEFVKRLNPPPLPPWAFFATAGTGAAAGLAGGAMAFLAQQTALQHNALATRGLDAPISGAELGGLERTARTQAMAANALFIGAGALAVGAAIELLFTNWEPAPADGRRLALSVGPGGFGLSAQF